MAKWQSNAESGILRKNPANENHEELLVFGYACKLFRDDEKALYIDQGKHLIPWMGDETLKIDRYDGRGALSELSQYEASREGYDAMRWLGLSESERHIEQLCDKERYYALTVNEDEEELYREEELKRLHQKSNEYQFNYDVQPDPETTIKIPTVEAEDEAFVPPSDLDVPSDIGIPKTVKENARIEKTALFVSKQGLQMEILIKTKQADNPQFSFLNQSDPLYKYYKHLLMAIKSGQYKVQTQENNSEPKQEDSHDLENSEDHYLHPSLLATSVQSAPATPPLTIPYRPSADCKYLQLVNRIQGNQQQIAPPIQPEAPQPQNSSIQLTYEQQQYYQQYYYAMQYYEYYKQLAQQYQDGEVDPKVLQYFQNLTQLMSFMQGAQGVGEMQQTQNQMPDNPYAQIVSNLSQSKEHLSYMPVGTTEQQGDGPQAQGNIAKGPVIYSQTQTQSSHSTPVVTPVGSPKVLPQSISDSQETLNTVPQQSEIENVQVQKHPLLHFAHYNSDSDENCDSDNENGDKKEQERSDIKIPSQEVQLIIDKMASYVSKNGMEFEAIVKAKGDSRFEFLNRGHEFHEYYKQKLNEYLGIKPKKREEEVKEKDAKKQNNVENKPKEKKVIAPVSFSIKKPKEEPPKEIKSALPVEESDEEETPTSTPTTVATSQMHTTITATTSTTVNTTATQNEESYSPSRTPPLRDLEQRQIILDKQISAADTGQNKKGDDTKGNKVLDGEDPILEMIDLTDDIEERRETKRAEDRKKDKILAAARERLALQLERKRKAAAFLRLMSVDSSKTDGKQARITANNMIDIVTVSSSNKGSSSRSSRNKAEMESSKERTKTRSTREHDSDYEEGEIKRHRKPSKKKKSHKRKHSREKHESRRYHKEHKKSKKRRRSRSRESHSSNSS